MVPTKATYTYAELLEQVSLFAGVLKDQGVVAGDRVIVVAKKLFLQDLNDILG